MEKLTDEQIEKAVTFWSSVITDPKYDIGAKAPQETLAESLFSLGKKEVTPEEVVMFRTALRNKLRNLNGNAPDLHVDYHPTPMLREAAEEAGMHVGMSLFPPKTNMWFRNGQVQVSYGYGAATQTL